MSFATKNRTIMAHTITGAIFCIGEEVLVELIARGVCASPDPIVREMGQKLINHLREDETN